VPFISFEDVEQLADIEELANMLGLKTKKYNASQVRCACPIHGGDDTTLAISPAIRSKRGSVGVFYCQKGKAGGDRIGLVAHCMEIGQQDAAFFIQEQYGKSTDTVTSTVSKKRATVPPEQKREPTRQFDPNEYLSKLTYSEEIEALGISEADAQALGIGFVTSGLHRGRIAIALRWPSGEIAGFGSVEGGTIKLPAKFIPPKVHVLKRA
jgi:hypothetical protein